MSREQLTVHTANWRHDFRLRTDTEADFVRFQFWAATVPKTCVFIYNIFGKAGPLFACLQNHGA